MSGKDHPPLALHILGFVAGAALQAFAWYHGGLCLLAVAQYMRGGPWPFAEWWYSFISFCLAVGAQTLGYLSFRGVELSRENIRLKAEIAKGASE